MAFGQLPAYAGGNALNFQPITNALSDVAQTNQANARLGLENQRLGMDAERLGLEKTRAASEMQTAGLQRQGLQQNIDQKDVEQFAARVGATASEPDPNKKAQMSTAL